MKSYYFSKLLLNRSDRILLLLHSTVQYTLWIQELRKMFTCKIQEVSVSNSYFQQQALYGKAKALIKHSYTKIQT